MLKLWLIGAALYAGTMGGAGAVAADEPAVVTQVRGAVLLAKHQLVLLDALRPGDTIEVAAGAELVVFDPARLRQFTLGGPARFLVGDDGAIVRQGGSGSLRLEGQDPAFGRALRRSDQVVAGAVMRAGIDLGGSPGAERIAPSMPVLGWRVQAHLGEWRLRLLDGERTVFDGTVAGTELTLPDSVRLQPEHRYRRELHWQRRDGSVQVDSVPLQALSAADDAQLMRLLPPADAPVAARVLFALYLRSLGVRSLARQIAPEIDGLYPPR